MRFDKLALTAQEALQQAMAIASEKQAGQTEPLHLLDALLSAGENNMNAIITRIGADPALLRARVAAEEDRMPKVSGGGYTGMPLPAGMGIPEGMSLPSPQFINITTQAVNIAESLGEPLQK